jgi:ribosomal protein S18 acetylase RimI-like enzyme
MTLSEIVPCTPSDAFELTALSKEIFFDSFAAQNTPEDMELYMKQAFTVEKLRQELNNPHSFFYFAKVDGKHIGYLKLNFLSAQTELQDAQALEIERIYVSKAYAGQGIGQALMNKALSVAREKGLLYVWLGVWEKNERAIRFYGKQGFQQFGSHKFVLGNDVQTDWLMKKMIE